MAHTLIDTNGLVERTSMHGGASGAGCEVVTDAAKQIELAAAVKRARGVAYILRP